MKRKLFSHDIEEVDEIDFQGQMHPATDALELNDQMILNLDSTDEKLRDLSCISLANLSSHMEPDFYAKFLNTHILKKLADRITDPYSQISYNSLSALQRLASLCRVHNGATLLETNFRQIMLLEVIKTQVDSAVKTVRLFITSKIEKKEALSTLG